MSSPKPASPARKIPVGTISVTGKHRFNSTPYESTLERDFLTLCAFDYRVSEVHSQPLKIDYVNSAGRRRKYTPDFLVYYHNDAHGIAQQKNTLCEIKPQAKLLNEKSQLAPKFEAATRYAESQGWEFKVFTEAEIRTPLLLNARFLLPYRDIEFDSQIVEMLLSRMADLQESLPQLLLSALSEDREQQLQYLPVLWYLVSTYQIGADLNVPLTMTSRIWRHSSPKTPPHEKT